MKPYVRASLAVAFGLLLVTAASLGAISSGPVGTASAQGGVFGEAFDKMTATAGGMSFSSIWSDEPDADELEELDAEETEHAIYEEWSIQGQNNELHEDSFNNHLQDTESIALMEGKNAYIRELENGSSESEARGAAKEAVSDYYSDRQMTLVATWNTSSTLANQTHTVADNTTDVDESSLYFDVRPDYAYGDPATYERAFETVDENVTLANGTKTPTAGLRVPVAEETAQEWPEIWTPDRGNETVTFEEPGATGSKDRDVYGVNVSGPSEDYDDKQVIEFDAFANQWEAVEDQNDDARDEMDVFVNETYDEYEQGTINTTELIDPYLGAREYSPDEDFEAFALSSLLSLGLDGPENMTNVGKMVVTDYETAAELEGIVMTDENPDGGLTVGETYDAEDLNGTQMVVTKSTTKELEGKFTLESAVDSDGNDYEQNESITYKTVNYETSNTTEYQDLMEELADLQKDVNERQQQERSGGGGGGDIGTSQKVLIALVASLGAAVLMGRS